MSESKNIWQIIYKQNKRLVSLRHTNRKYPPKTSKDKEYINK